MKNGLPCYYICGFAVTKCNEMMIKTLAGFLCRVLVEINFLMRISSEMHRGDV